VAGTILILFGASIILLLLMVRLRPPRTKDAAIGKLKLNSAGLKLCAAYVVFVILVLTWAYFSSDPKSRFVIGSFAWLPFGITFGILHLFPLVDANPWMNTPFFLLPMSLLIVYLVGWGFSSIGSIVTGRRKAALERRLAEAKENDD
jgi:hypothetical protein